jgi:hypothetical protein
MRFKDFVKLIEISLSAPFGIVIPPSVFGAVPSINTSQSADMPMRSGGWDGSNLTGMSFDLALPAVNKTAKIEYMNTKTNPILIYLSDGSRLYIPYDSFKRIKGEPRVGKMMMVSMQRRGDDASKTPSQIQSIHAF